MATTSHRRQYVREISHWLTAIEILNNFRCTSWGEKRWKHENNSRADGIENNVAWDECDIITWWSHQMEWMEWFFALLSLCAWNSLVTGEFPSQRPVTHSFDVFFHLRLNKWLSKQSRRRWFEPQSRSLWRHRNEIYIHKLYIRIRLCIHICISTETN